VARLEKVDDLKDADIVEIYNDAFRVPLTVEQLFGGVKKAVIRDLNLYYEVINQKD
jgi:hypothetical protein